MLGRGQAVVIPEAAHERLVGTELGGLSTTNRVANVPREHAEAIAAGRDDAGDHVVLQLEDRFRLEGAIIGLGPQTGAGTCIHKLHCDA